ncbi:peroxisomal biogenesis factor 19 [Lycorma delicatula]|uniref:peroxisomal biogenesis factor 19 n=1 Tax=Lycorma delicatula TaxID=130591 RepID=UPI003F512B8E
MAEEIKEVYEESLITTPSEKDEELDALLDSALQDFDKPPASSNDKSEATVDSLTSGNNSDPPDVSGNETFSDVMDEDAMKKLMSQFEQTFHSLLTEGGDENMAELSEQFSKDFKKIAEDTMKEIKEETGSTDNEFTATIAETLKNLSENAGSLQGNGDDIMGMLGALGLGGGSDSNPADFSSLFNNIMQTFLSKDILYPSLKELVTKYPEWLEENKSSLSKDDYSRYTKQLEIMNKVCEEMECATDNDNEEVKSKRFSVVLGLMQQMQDYGHPPKSLMGDSFDIPQWL